MDCSKRRRFAARGTVLRKAFEDDVQLMDLLMLCLPQELHSHSRPEPRSWARAGKNVLGVSEHQSSRYLEP